MVKSIASHRRRRRRSRSSLRSVVRPALRSPNRAAIRNLPGYRPGPGDLSQALAAFARAIRAHRRLARLAPEFFDSTEVNRLARRRLADAEWRASWEPAFNKVYGPPKPGQAIHDPLAGLPPLPRSVRTRRAVERELAALQLWSAAGRLALARHRQRRPQALPSLAAVVRLLRIAMDFGQLACGAPPDMAAESAAHEQCLADLARIYGRPSPPLSAARPARGEEGDPQAPAAAQPPPQPSRPVDDKRDFTLCKLAIGPHGLLCLQPIEETLPAKHNP